MALKKSNGGIIMKIGIVGAGFFGLHLAHQIKLKYPKAKIDLFEMNEEAMLGASVNNQCRLHLGFHYPRSGYTIYQSVMGFDDYLKYYEDCVAEMPENFYAIHKNGYVNATEYMAVMDSFSLPYKIEENINSFFKKPDDIELLLRVAEKSIDPKKVRKKLLSFKKVNIITGTKIDFIDAESGELFSENKNLGQYDYLINATYMDPNLGLPPENRFDLKYELTLLLLGKTNLPASTGLTIMDGPYASVYPAYDGLHTLSSVVHTPFKIITETDDLYDQYQQRFEIAKEFNVEEKILQHVNELFNIEFSLKEYWVSSKTKLATDKGDSRITEVKRHGRLLSVMCGKLDAIFFAVDKIMGEING